MENPRDLFLSWQAEAAPVEAEKATVMTLSTVDKDGLPDSRMVLYKGMNEDGFRLFTNYESPKSQQMRRFPFASLVFFWPTQYRQVRVKGHVRPLDEEASDEYFASRARDSQLSAWASPQSALISSYAALEARKGQISQKFEGKDVPRPPFWGGFVVIPDYWEFWEGKEARFHERVAYWPEKGSWKKGSLAP